jgi:nucleoside-diphosphate-sugar epimerase
MTAGKTPYRHAYIMGCGDIGTRVAQRWQAQGIAVTGIVRSRPSRERLAQAGIDTVQCDLGDSECCLPPIDAGSLLYYFSPPPAQGRQDTHVRQLLTCLEQQPEQAARIVAISTTGVYGDRGGDMVTEDEPPNPQVDRARRRYDMECRLRDWCAQQQVDLIILRVGGIYGPGRLPLERIKQGIPMLHEHLAPKTNRIHADDLAQVCVAAAKVEQHYRVYNVSDGTDSNMTEYFLTLADYFHLPRPPLVDWDEAEKLISPGMLSYLRESRRVDNTRMLKELKVRLQYPDLLSGLESCKE